MTILFDVFPGTEKAKKLFVQAALSYQVHGRAPRRMWFDKQLRGRLSKVLYLCLHGLQGKESDCHNRYASTREVITLPASASGSQVSHERRPENPPGALSLRVQNHPRVSML